MKAFNMFGEEEMEAGADEISDSTVTGTPDVSVSQVPATC